MGDRDLPFLWKPPAGAGAGISLLVNDAQVAAATRPAYCGLEGNEHLQEPFVYASVFSRDECERIKAIGGARPVWNGRSTAQEENYRVCKTSWIEEATETGFIFDRLRKVVKSVNGLYRAQAAGFGEPLHYIWYEPGGHFEWHTDLGAGPMSTRKISLSVQLSAADEYDGGDFEFCPHGVIEEFRGLGNVIAFPSFIAHRVLPVTRGSRHALVAWIHGPAFR